MTTEDQAAAVRRIVEDVEYLKDLAADLRSVTWLAPVSASEMNTRDRWLADELDKTADRLLAVLSAPHETAYDEVVMSAYQQAQDNWNAQCFCFTSAPESMRRTAHEVAREGFSEIVKTLGPLARPLLDAEYEAARKAAAVLSAPPAEPSDSATIWHIDVFREDDGQIAASFESADHAIAGMGNYSTTVVGALAELCATLLKLDEDKTAAASPAPAPPAEPQQAITVDGEDFKTVQSALDAACVRVELWLERNANTVTGKPHGLALSELSMAIHPLRVFVGAWRQQRGLWNLKAAASPTPDTRQEDR